MKKRNIPVIDVNQLAQAATAAASKEIVVQFSKGISRVLGPAADEFALMLADGMREFRRKNAVSILAMAEPLAERKEPSFQASPRVVATILDQGSWTDSEMLQRYWANLLVNAMTPDGRDEESLLYAPILQRLTSVQAKLLLELFEITLVERLHIYTTRDWIAKTGAKNRDHFAAELDVLSALRIVGYDPEAHLMVKMDDIFTVGFSNFGKTFYARINGHIGNVDDFFTPQPK